MTKNIITDALIEDGRITYSEKRIPKGKLQVKIVYRTGSKRENAELADLIELSKGLYKNIKADTEAKKLRSQWDRKIEK